MAEGTAEAMARGGMYDQLAGGFARYSVDADWVVPHFEKMLYDNALLARVYAHLWRRTGTGLARGIAEQTCDWLIAELRTAEGGFAAALDADSDGAEGAFYVWTPAELTAALGAADGALRRAAYGVTAAGTFEHGSSVLQLRADPADATRLEAVRLKLLAARGAARPGRPGRQGGRGLERPGDRGAGRSRRRCSAGRTSSPPRRAAGELLAGVHLQAGRLARTSRDGVASGDRGRARRLRLRGRRLHRVGQRRPGPVAGPAPGAAGELLAVALDRFRAADGSFYDTADDSRAADLPACGRGRRSEPVGHVRGGGRPAQLLRADRVGRNTGRPPRRARQRAGARRAVSRGRLAGGSRWLRRCSSGRPR